MYGECGWLAIARPVVGKTGTGCLSEAKKGRAARAASANGTGGGRIKAHGMIIGRQVLASINQHGGGRITKRVFGPVGVVTASASESFFLLAHHCESCRLSPRYLLLGKDRHLVRGVADLCYVDRASILVNIFGDNKLEASSSSTVTLFGPPQPHSAHSLVLFAFRHG